MAKSILIAIFNAYEELEEQTCDVRETGVTSDDVSKAMVPFLTDIKKLSELSDPKALELAYLRILYLGKHSYAELDSKACGYGDRKSDEPADELLLSILTKRKERKDEWDYVPDLHDLEKRAKLLRAYGINTWLTESIKLLREWAGPKGEDESSGEEDIEDDDILDDDSEEDDSDSDDGR